MLHQLKTLKDVYYQFPLLCRLHSCRRARAWNHGPRYWCGCHPFFEGKVTAASSFAADAIELHVTNIQVNTTSSLYKFALQALGKI